MPSRPRPPARHSLKAITNNLHVANTLGPREDVEVIVVTASCGSSAAAWAGSIRAANDLSTFAEPQVVT